MNNVEDIYPLTPSQLGVLFRIIDAPASGSYFVQVVFTFDGILDDTRFMRAFSRLLGRHAVLRTAFFWEDLDHPVQVVRAQVELQWHIENLFAMPQEDRDGRLGSFLSEDRALGFDIRRAPLMRAALLHESETIHRFVWSFHHLVVDGWTWPILWNDVRALYREASSSLPPAPSFRAYVEWLGQQDVEAAKAFWSNRLAGWRATPLPLETAASAESTAPDVTTLEFSLATADHAALQSFARLHGLTLGTLIQAAWALVLAGFADVFDVTFGVVTAGRPAECPGVATMAGMFVNVLPLRVHIDPGQPVSSWLQHLQVNATANRAYEWVSLADVQARAGAGFEAPLFASVVDGAELPG